MSPLFINWPISLTIKSLFNWPMFPLQPLLYIYIRLRVLRLLRPFYKSPYIYIYIYIRLHIPRLLKPSYKSLVSRLQITCKLNAMGPLKLAYVSTAQSFACVSILLSRLVTVILLSHYRRVTVVLLSLLTSSRTLRLLKPSFKSPECIRY